MQPATDQRLLVRHRGSVEQRWCNRATLTPRIPVETAGGQDMALPTLQGTNISRYKGTFWRWLSFSQGWDMFVPRRVSPASSTQMLHMFFPHVCHDSMELEWQRLSKMRTKEILPVEKCFAMPSNTFIPVDNLPQSATCFAMNVPCGESSKHHSFRCTKR